MGVERERERASERKRERQEQRERRTDSYHESTFLRSIYLHTLRGARFPSIDERAACNPPRGREK